jgi:hypothetical protein
MHFLCLINYVVHVELKHLKKEATERVVIQLKFRRCLGW